MDQKSAELKRNYESYSFGNDDLKLEEPFTDDSQFVRQFNSQEFSEPKQQDAMIPAPLAINSMERSVQGVNLSRRSSSASLSDIQSRTPSLGADSPMPATPSHLMSSTTSAMPDMPAINCAPPITVKRRKLTFKEKEDERIIKQIKDAEKQQKEAAREADRQKREADKAAKEAEKKNREADKAVKESKRKKKEVEKEIERKKREVEKEEKRLAVEAERAAKAEIRRKKEEEKQLAEEKKKKEERKQKPIMSFFGKTAVSPGSKSIVKGRSESPSPAVAATASDTPSKPENLPYDTLFPPFFRKEDVSLAPYNRFERDEEGSAAIQALIDGYINGGRSLDQQTPFDAWSLFHMQTRDTLPRGKQCTPVREIMAQFSGKLLRPIDLTTGSQNTQFKRTSDQLKKVPMKYLKFQEDVRPPYRGTYTSRPVNGMAKLARNPLRRDLPDTNYDYDSEAEWVEEEGDEDIDSDGEDDEVDEDGDDMEGFLDDEGDVMNSKRMIIQGDMEPISTGLCWEDQNKRNTNLKMVAYRMEVILDHELKSIDPFSTEYWAPPPKIISKMEPPRIPLDAIKSSSSAMNANANKTVMPFFTPASELAKDHANQSIATQAAPASTASKQENPKTDKPPKKLLPLEDMEHFRNEVRGSDLSKVGMIEVLKKKFPLRTAAQIKGSLEMFASRVGKKEADKRWVLLDEVSS
ncbi:chromatin assembly factor 1 subunit A-domain-containing protein [Calycina marina]|uniref:Chromatin assembly factor 1 subunit A-domain-containing protein n=1 Tax=Calycina marina TaxID=1763456 RepID=A0A9P7Z405_9HELO|nr:chromatin assembly factor 1 subunit A-domain-containing protein [Calycina marina]